MSGRFFFTCLKQCFINLQQLTGSILPVVCFQSDHI